MLLSPLSTASTGLEPVSPPSPLSRGFKPRAPRRVQTHPVPLEPLSFAKIPVEPVSGPSSAVPSTDSECFSDAEVAGLCGSPSLLTCLIQSQSRLASAHGSPVKSSVDLHPSSPTTTRPILRRESTPSHSDEEPKEARPAIRHRRSCLKFAVTPRPLQLHSGSSRRGSSDHRPFDSPAPSRSSRLDSDDDVAEEDQDNDDDDDEEQDEDDLEHVYTPGWGSDSDAGYREDSEDGFTSEEEGLSLPSARWRPYTTQWSGTPAPILTSPRRLPVSDCPSTTDDGEPGTVRTRTRIRINDEGRQSRKPTRHRSPPPKSHGTLDARPAPPAARSPSAAELCRRRSGVARSPCPSRVGILAATRGWRSDDGRSQVDPRPRANSTIKFEVCDDELNALRKLRQDRRRPPSAFRLVRRDSAPAKIDEVHVLTSAQAGPCPRRGLKDVLRTARAH